MLDAATFGSKLDSNMQSLHNKLASDKISRSFHAMLMISSDDDEPDDIDNNVGLSLIPSSLNRPVKPNKVRGVSKEFGKSGEYRCVSYTTWNHALFRHGDRTPDIGTMYPKDPNINATYYPIGIGQLTKRGKQREFQLGKLIRRQYDEFLGDTYIPGHVEATSTDMNRTKASLELVLAGIYPPKGTQLEWNPALNWDPIPYNYLNYMTDMWMTISTYFCPKYAKLYQEYLKSSEALEIIERNRELYQYLSANTGLNVTTPLEVWGIYSNLQSQKEWGFKLPFWARTVYPDTLEAATVEALKTLIATTEMKQLSGGYMLKRIIDNMYEKVENNIQPENRKLILYSAHDINVLYMTGVLNQKLERSIPYSSYYIIELVEDYNEDHFVQIYANDYVTQEKIPITIPGCEFQCPLEEFSILLQEYIPDSEDKCEDDLYFVSQYKYKRDYYLGRVNHRSAVQYYQREAARLRDLEHKRELEN